MTPQPRWQKTTVEETVNIPHTDGEGIARTIRVTVDAWQDPKNGEIYLDAAALKKLDDIRARHMGLMLPEEIRELREYLGLTQAEISRLLQLGERTWTRWETGRSRPTHSYNLLLNALADGRIDLNYLQLRAASPPARKHVRARPRRNSSIRYHVHPVPQALAPEMAA